MWRGVALILLCVSIMLTIIGFASDKQSEDQLALIGVIVILLGVVVAVPLFIIHGTKVDEFKKNLVNYYEDKDLMSIKLFLRNCWMRF